MLVVVAISISGFTGVPTWPRAPTQKKAKKKKKKAKLTRERAPVDGTDPNIILPAHYTAQINEKVWNRLEIITLSPGESFTSGQFIKPCDIDISPWHSTRSCAIAIEADKRPYYIRKCIVIRRRHKRTSISGLTQIFSLAGSTLIWAEGEIRNRSKKGDGVFLRQDDDRRAPLFAEMLRRNAAHCGNSQRP